MVKHFSESLFATSLLSSAVVVALIGIGAPLSVSAQAKPAAEVKAPANQAATTVKKAPAGKPAKRATRKEPEAPAAPEVEVADADDTQLLAAKEVHMGESGCEFGQKIQLDANGKHPGYVDLSFNQKKYTMKPVLSATGALRLEDVRSETLMIQIASKTMVMNQKTGQRLVDNCIHPNQQTVTADNQVLMMK